MSTVVEKMVRFAHALQFADLPEAVISESKRLLLDSVGCAIAGLGTDKGKIVVQLAKEMGGAPEAKVLGTGLSVSVTAAAFANGELVNLLDFDALISPPGHVCPYIIPAMLATAEKSGSSGKELILALAASHEVSARFGHAMGDVRSVPAGEKISFPAISGYASSIFGGTLGTAMLAGLNQAQTSSALGLAGHIAPAQSMGKWVRTMPATTEKYVMAGWMNQAELLSVQLAKSGYVGDVGVLDGEFGFWRYMGSNRWIPEALTDGLGLDWRFPNMAIYKPYPHCRISQTVFDCLIDLIEKHSLQPEEIERVDAYCDPHGALLPMWSTKNIASCLDAQMSVPFGVSLVAHRVPTGPEWQDNETMTNRRYLAFMDRVTVQAHPDFETTIKKEPGSRIGKVDVFARGQSFSEERKYRKGSPASIETKMSDAELVDKFEHNASRYLSAVAIAEISKLLMNLEDVDDVSRQVAKLW